MLKMCDPNVLDMNELIDRIGGDEEFALELLREFRGNLDQEISELKLTLEEGDPTTVSEKSHSLKGSALNLSAKSFASVAKIMEHAGRDGDVATAADQYPNLVSESDKLKQAIDSLNE
jgi:HPt (histidine-containing phosphotransfer) domain-containing protein